MTILHTITVTIFSREKQWKVESGFGGRRVSGIKVIEGDLQKFPLGSRNPPKTPV